MNPSSTFVARDADGYERVMGRWSERLAQPFLDFAGTANGERVLDVGCGTGHLAFAVAAASEPAEVQAFDLSPIYMRSAAFSRGRPVVRRRAARAHAWRVESAYDVRSAGLQSPARSLSGGNLQKMILGRALLAPDWRHAQARAAFSSSRTSRPGDSTSAPSPTCSSN